MPLDEQLAVVRLVGDLDASVAFALAEQLADLEDKKPDRLIIDMAAVGFLDCAAAQTIEDDPLHIMRALEREGWLQVLHPHWSMAKVDSGDLGQVVKTRQMMNDLGYTVEQLPLIRTDLYLFFHHDWNVGTNLAGDRFC